MIPAFVGGLMLDSMDCGVRGDEAAERRYCLCRNARAIEQRF